MKRGGFLKRKTPLRSRGTGLRTNVQLKTKVRLRQASRDSLPTLERAIWKMCRAIIRIIYPPRCYTCGQANLRGKNWQTGHMWPKANLGAFMKYDLRVLRPQCYRCNIDLGGNGAEFITRMTAERGPMYMQKLTQDRQVSVRAYDHYHKLAALYKEVLLDFGTHSPTLSKLRDILSFVPDMSFINRVVGRVGEYHL